MLLTITASAITFLINHEALNIALASVSGFFTAQIFAGIFYQVFINRSFFVKVNGSDFIAICFDSFVFQLVAFHEFSPTITVGQILIKLTGGYIWYLILFKKLKINEKISRS